MLLCIFMHVYQSLLQAELSLQGATRVGVAPLYLIHISSRYQETVLSKELQLLEFWYILMEMKMPE